MAVFDHAGGSVGLVVLVLDESVKVQRKHIKRILSLMEVFMERMI